MRNVIVLLLALTVLNGCKHNETCNGISTYSKIDTRMEGFVFKPGTYWVYLDSTDGIKDSQYVYSYTYRVHYRNPIDTPNPYYALTGSVGGSQSTTYCGPYYKDSLSMSFVSYYNGLINDTFSIFAYEYLFLWDHHVSSSLDIDIYRLTTPDTGLIYKAVSEGNLPPGDTLEFWYNGIQNTLSEAAATFADANIYEVQFIDPNSTRFKYPTDLYFVSGTGIVKMVQHKNTGNVTWNLINFHIAG